MLLPGATLSINYETRSYAGSALAAAADYQTNWAALTTTFPTPPAGFGATPLASWSGIANQSTFAGGAGVNIAYHVTVNFSVAPAEAGTWDFRLGIDFGLGGAAFLDGTLLDFRNSDMWWDGSFASPAQLLSGSRLLAAGNHVLEVYGLEACCDGLTTGQFRAPGRGFETFSTVPEAGSLWLAGFGLGLVLTGRGYFPRASSRRRARTAVEAGPAPSAFATR